MYPKPFPNTHKKKMKKYSDFLYFLKQRKETKIFMFRLALRAKCDNMQRKPRLNKPKRWSDAWPKSRLEYQFICNNIITNWHGNGVFLIAFGIVVGMCVCVLYAFVWCVCLEWRASVHEWKEINIEYLISMLQIRINCLFVLFVFFSSSSSLLCSALTAILSVNSQNKYVICNESKRIHIKQIIIISN